MAGIALAASVAYLTLFFPWAEIGALLTQVNWLPLGLAVTLLQVVYLLVRALRWVVLVKTANPAASLLDLYLPNAVLVSFAIVTPGQVGEILKVEVLKRSGILQRTEAFGLLALERGLDLLVLLGLGGLGLVSLSADDRLSGRYPIEGLVLLPLAAILVGAAVLRVARKRWPTVLRRTGLFGLGPGSIAGALSLSVVSWLLVAWVWHLVLAAIGVALGLPESMALLALTTLGGMLSFVPGALGVAEVISAELLQQFGSDALRAGAGAVMLRLYTVAILVIGLLHLLFWLRVRR